MQEVVLTAEQAQRRLGIGRSLFWPLIRRYEVPQLSEPTATNSRGHRSVFRIGDVERLREPTRQVLAAVGRVPANTGR